MSGLKSETPENRDRWTPSLDGVLEQKSGNEGRKNEAVDMNEIAERYSQECQGRGVRLDRSLDVPFFG